jgi:hypothetical protein
VASFACPFACQKCALPEIVHADYNHLLGCSLMSLTLHVLFSNARAPLQSPQLHAFVRVATVPRLRHWPRENLGWHGVPMQSPGVLPLQMPTERLI